MTTKNLVILAGVAAVLGGAAYYTQNGRKMSVPSLVGKKILPAFSVADVARVDIANGKVKLVGGDKGWTVESLFGYPADLTKIRENLLKLQDLTVGQVVNGRKLPVTTLVDLQNAQGKSLASVTLGDQHMGKPRGQMAQFGGGGYPDGRYVKFEEKAVLVKDTLDAFDGDPKKWCDTRICAVTASDVASVVYTQGKEKVELSRGTNNVWQLKGLGPQEELDSSKTYSLDSALSYLDFTGVADPAQEATYGFATGAVYTVTLKSGSNYVARVGNTVATGSDRYFKLDGKPWIYTISSYAADNMRKTRKDLVKAKEEPKKEEPKKDEPKK